MQACLSVATYQIVVLVLSAQYALGIAISLWVTLPNDGDSADNWAAAWAQPVVAAHIVIGGVIVVSALVLLVVGAARCDTVAMGASALTLLFAVLAAGCGAAFVITQLAVYSYIMALAFVPLLMLCTSGRTGPLRSLFDKDA